MTQVFARYAKDMLEKQTYPEVRRGPNAPPEPPYDVTAWSLGMLLGVDTVFVNNPLPAFKMTKVDGAAEGRRRCQRQRIPVRVRLQGTRHRDRDQPAAEGRRAGRLRRPVARVGRRRLARKGRAGGERARARGEGVSGTANDERRTSNDRTTNDDRRAAEAASTPFHAPRVAMYQPWTGGNMDEGWTRWVLEQYEFNLTSIHNADIRAGKLRQKFDAIIIADQNARDILDGFDAPSIRPEYRGGIGDAGLEQPEAVRRRRRHADHDGQRVRSRDRQPADPGAQPEEGADARPALRPGHDPQARGRHAASDRLRRRARHLRLLHQQPVLLGRSRASRRTRPASSRAIRTPTSSRRAGCEAKKRWPAAPPSSRST